jgi:hypothetical protein
MAEIIMEVASNALLDETASFTHHPASSEGFGHPSPPMVRLLSASDAHRSSIAASVHPSPRNSMQEGPVHWFEKEQLPMTDVC